MPKQTTGDILRQNWYLALGLVLCVGFALYGLYGAVSASSGASAAGNNNAAKDQADGSNLTNKEREIKELLELPPPDPITDAEQTREQIGEYEEKLANDNPPPEKTAEYLLGKANLHRKLQEYDQAAEAFQQIILNYPDSTAARNAYTQLHTCYKRLGDQQGQRWVLQRILQDFPEDSDHHIWAEMELGLRSTNPYEDQ